MLACNLVFKLDPKKTKIMVSLADTKKVHITTIRCEAKVLNIRLWQKRGI